MLAMYCYYIKTSVVDLGGWGAVTPSPAISGHTKGWMFYYKNTLKHTNSRVSLAPACACNGHTYTKRKTVTGNDACSLHITQFFIQACLL